MNRMPAFLALFLSVLAAIALDLDVIGFTVHTWASNETYTHGFLIVPISLWLIWRKHRILARMYPEPELRGLVPILFLSIAWQFGHQADVMVVQQYCLVGMIVAAAWTLLGAKYFQQISFPLFFLFLAVPIGEALIPFLMDFTADFTVSALQLTGIPVYREGTFFSLPDGNWSVIEACSGLRYLISSLTLGILYAYLTYRSLSRKLIFIALSATVPILANGIRAYMIVMVGHLSGMRLAVGIDHLIYGWVFFGLVMLVLFRIGAFFREKESSSQAEERLETETAGPPPARFFIAASVIVSLILSNGAYALFLDRKQQTPVAIRLEMTASSGWQESLDPLSRWTPHYLGSKETFVRNYRKDGETVSIFVAYYRNQQQGAELVTSENKLVTTRDAIWGDVGEKAIGLPVGAKSLRLRQTLLKSPGSRLLAWEWYWVDGRWTSNPYLAKFLEAKSRMFEGTDAAAVIVVSAPYFTDPVPASASLGNFLRQSLPGIEAMLKNAEKQS